MMLRIKILQYLDNVSDRLMEAQLLYNLAQRYFIGLARPGPLDPQLLPRPRQRRSLRPPVRAMVEAARYENVIGAGSTP